MPESQCYLLATDSPYYQEEAKRYAMSLGEHDQHYLASVNSDSRRQEYIVSRGLLRELLAKHTGIASEHWALPKDSHGRLYATHTLDSHQAIAIPDINISHTKNMLVVALCIQGRIGVDVEHAARKVNHTRLSQRFFTPREQSWIEQQADSKAAFLELWTIKEAYLKAVGTGISDQLAFAEFEKDMKGNWCWTQPSGHSDKLTKPTIIKHQTIGDIHFSYVLTESTAEPYLEIVT